MKIRDVVKHLELDGWSEMKYLVIYEKSSAGWGAYAPTSPVLASSLKRWTRQEI